MGYTRKEMKNGIINLDTDRAKAIGFTSDKYEGYLWKQGDAVMVSFIVSKKRGNFCELVRRIHALGLTVKVPTPLGAMLQILLKNEFAHTTEIDRGGAIDVWVLVPPRDAKSTEPQPGEISLKQFLSEEAEKLGIGKSTIHYRLLKEPLKFYPDIHVRKPNQRVVFVRRKK